MTAHCDRQRRVPALTGAVSVCRVIRERLKDVDAEEVGPVLVPAEVAERVDVFRNIHRNAWLRV